MISITYDAELGQLREHLALCQSIVIDQAQQIQTLTEENTNFRERFADRNEELDRCYRRINTYEDEKRYENRLFKVGAAHLSPADKLIVREVRNLNRRTQNDPYAQNRVCLSVLAQNIGASESNVGRRVKGLAAANFIETVTTQPTKDDDRSHLDIALLPILDDPEDIKRDQERKHGGLHVCECGEVKKNRYGIDVCENTNHVTMRDLPGNTIPLAFQDAFKIVILDQAQDTLVESHKLEITDVDTLENLSIEKENQGDEPARLALITAIVGIMSNYQVKHDPLTTCHCGCQLWRNVLGVLECCKCTPSPLWPNKYSEAIHILYPDRKANQHGTRT